MKFQLCLLTALFAFSAQSGFAKYQPDYKLPKDLKSKPQLMQKGAQCNTDGNLDCSVAVFSKALAIDPFDSTARANLAFALTGLGQHGEAVKVYEEVIKQGGGTYDTHAYYAKSLLALDKKEEALKHYQKCIKINPRLVDVVEKIAMLQGDLGNKKAGIRTIDKFVKKHPEAKSYLQAMRTRLTNQ